MRSLRFMLLPVAVLLFTPDLVSAREAGKGKVYKTPQEVFAAAKQAAANDNWKESCACLTAESRDLLAGVLVMATRQMVIFALTGTKAAKDKESTAFVRKVIGPFVERIANAYVKHGLTDKTIKDLEQSNSSAPDKGEPALKVYQTTFTRLGKLIKDKPGFIAEMMPATREFVRTILTKEFMKIADGQPEITKVSDKGGRDFWFLAKDARLEDLKIEGDTAKGMVATKGRGVERRAPIAFTKVGRGWRIELRIEEFVRKR